MMRRMSKRLAMRAADASSSAVAPVESVVGPRNGWGWSAMTVLLDEDDVEDHDEGDRPARQQPHRAVPRVVAGVALLVGFVRPRQPPHQSAQLRLRLGLGDQ